MFSAFFVFIDMRDIKNGVIAPFFLCLSEVYT